MISTRVLCIQTILIILTIQIATTLTSTTLLDNNTEKTLEFEKESQMDFPYIVEYYGYKSETHTVTTEDGYILKVFRIVKADHCAKKPPVLVGHGFLLAAESFIDAGPDYALAYLLSDACFDVWVVNQRGTYHGRSHISLNPDEDEKFWEFSYQEMGKYDQPAFVDYILRETGAEYINYVGYSQNGGIFSIMCSERPEYNDKIGVAVLLAPGTRMYNSRSQAFRLLARSTNDLKILYSATATNELLARNSLSQSSLQLLCALIYRIVCDTFITVIDSYHIGSITDRTLKVLSGHMPAGVSRQELEHFHQALNSKNYLAFDFGKKKNLNVYGTESPPAFNLTAVTTDVVLMGGLNDHVVDIKDIKWLASQLPNVLEMKVIGDEKWNHFDFMYSRYIPDVISPTVIKYLNQYS